MNEKEDTLSVEHVDQEINELLGILNTFFLLDQDEQKELCSDLCPIQNLIKNFLSGFLGINRRYKGPEPSSQGTSKCTEK
jgi:citrate lyase synthetase